MVGVGVEWLLTDSLVGDSLRSSSVTCQRVAICFVGTASGKDLGIGMAFVEMWPLWQKVGIAAWVIGVDLLVVVVLLWIAARWR